MMWGTIAMVRARSDIVVGESHHRSVAQATVTGRLNSSCSHAERCPLDGAWFRKRLSAETVTHNAAADSRARIAQDRRARLAEMARTIGGSS
ncbi:MAG: hypothetical protein JWN66_2876 [Sphingomonas bacterium]|jgi:hypothetical protein|nr:hypothetical protein [Sphingomonas bacterium]